MANNPESNNQQSNKKQFAAWYKKPKNGSLASMIWTMFREYGIFVIAFAFCYMLFYYVIFEGSGDNLRAMYAVIASALLAVTLASFFLRKLWRQHKLRKYSLERVPLFKNNVWRCPNCGKENRLLSPCPECGVFPVLYKSDKKLKTAAEGGKTVKNKRLQKQYDEYKPVFSADEEE